MKLLLSKAKPLLRYAKRRVPASVWRVIFRAQLYYRRRQIRSRIGSGAVIDPTAHVLGWRNVSIGNGSVLCEQVTLNINDYRAGASIIEIGAYCWVGRRNFFSSGASIVFDDYVMTGPDCQFLGANHVVSDPYRPYISTGTKSMGGIHVGANVWFGSRSSVLGEVRIGHGSVIGANSMVTRDVPPFSLVVGSPARVIKRYHFGRNEWIVTADIDELAESLMPDSEKYLAILRSNNEQVALPIRAAGKSMIDTY